MQLLAIAQGYSSSLRLGRAAPRLPRCLTVFPEWSTSDRIVGSHRGTLLAWLALRADRTSVRYPWEHPRLDEMTPEHRRILAHARTFSEVMHGAALLYNLLLSEEGKLAELADRHAKAFAAWAADLDTAAAARWSVADLMATARGQGGHRIGPHTEDFVGRWAASSSAGRTSRCS